MRQGAVIVDVRTAGEFDRGKVRHSINIPLDRLELNIARLKDMKKPIVILGNQHMISHKAVAWLRSQGIREVYDGGNWERYLRR